MTRHSGVLGYPLHHTISPAFQQPAFDALGLDVTYHVWAVPPEEVAAFTGRLRQSDHLGCNVTIPYKEVVPAYLDGIANDAARLGAVNTIHNSGGLLTGYNTDVIGFRQALQNEGSFDPHNARVVVLGAGGAALACVAALTDAGAATIAITNRTPDRAYRLAERCAAWSGSTTLSIISPTEVANHLATCDLLVNTTSVGMLRGPAPSEVPLDSTAIEALGAHILVYDLVYNPARTPLLEAATERGARTLEGLPMLVYQGAASFEIWTGSTAPVALMMQHAAVKMQSLQTKE